MKTNFSIEEIIDYSKCPFKYKLKYILEKDVKKINVVEKYEADLKQILYRMFRIISDEKFMDIDELKKLWAKLWIKKNKKSGFIYYEPKSWRDTFGQYSRKGIKALVSIYEDFETDAGIPIIINQDYRLKIADDITITGRWDIVREIDENDRKITEIISANSMSQFTTINEKLDLKVTADSLAFSTAFKFNEDRIMYYYLEKQKKKYVKRNKEAYKSLVSDCKKIVQAIRADLFYRVPTEKCHVCAYRNVCYKEQN